MKGTNAEQRVPLGIKGAILLWAPRPLSGTYFVEHGVTQGREGEAGLHLHFKADKGDGML